jgi:opacity protein-like surface antigen
MPALGSALGGFRAGASGYSRRTEMPMQNRWGHFVLAVVAVIPMCCHAQAEMFEPERVGRWYLYGAAGEETNSQLVNLDGQFGLAIGAGYRLTRYVALEIDGLFASQRVDAPSTIPGLALGTDGRATVYTRGIGGLVKFTLPLDRVELYVGGGLGIYNTSLFTDVGFQTVAGADFFVSRRLSVGLEYRRLKFDAILGALVPGVELGGDFLFATVRGHL